MTCNVGELNGRSGTSWELRCSGSEPLQVAPVRTGIASVVGTIASVMGMIGFCPAWTLLGINTFPTKKG